MSVFSTRAFDKHEQVVFCSDPTTGLRAIIAIHSTVLGPAVGGCRFWDYAAIHRNASPELAQARAEEDAILDVLRLSRGMSYKNAMAGLRLGGGKSVIMGDARTLKSPDLLRSFGAFINRLGGRYYTAEDMGIKPQDLEIVHEQTDHVVGLENGDFATGDPSPHTALGVFAGIQAAVHYKFGQDDLNGLTVAIQGVGNVGRDLANHLRNAGARIIISDIVQDNIEQVLAGGEATVVEGDRILTADADIFAPCAMGGVLNSRTIPQLKAKIVAGSANNVLDDETRDGQELLKRGILYAPDYVINAGGIISVETEVHKEKLDHKARAAKVARIGDTLKEVFAASDKKGRPTGLIANEIAEKHIEDGRRAMLAAAQ